MNNEGLPSNSELDLVSAIEKLTTLISRLEEVENEKKHFFQVHKGIAEYELAKRINNIIGFLTPRDPIGMTYQRYGRDFDGGYVVIDDFNGEIHLVSAGIGDDISFEKELSAKVSKVTIVGTLENLPSSLPANFVHKNLFLGVPNEKESRVSLRDIMSEIEEELLLKVDIEGEEWEVFNDLSSQEISRFRQILVEFHGLGTPSDSFEYAKKYLVLEKLLITHQVVNVHANNYGRYYVTGGVPMPDTLEVTYLRRDICDFDSDFPDRGSEFNLPNSPYMPDFKVWWI